MADFLLTESFSRLVGNRHNQFRVLAEMLLFCSREGFHLLRDSDSSAAWETKSVEQEHEKQILLLESEQQRILSLPWQQGDAFYLLHRAKSEVLPRFWGHADYGQPIGIQR